MILEQPKDGVNDLAVNCVSGQEEEVSKPSDDERFKGTQQVGAQVESAATIETSTSNADMQGAHRFSDLGSGSIPQSNLQPQAVRLADDFELPAAMMHMAAIDEGHEGTQPMTPQIKAVVDHLVDEFYRDVAKADEPGSNAKSQTEELSEDQSNFDTDEESGEMTRVITPTDGSLQATEKANRSHQLLFGDEAANRFGIQSKLEVKLPVDGLE